MRKSAFSTIWFFDLTSLPLYNTSASSLLVIEVPSPTLLSYHSGAVADVCYQYGRDITSGLDLLVTEQSKKMPYFIPT